MPSTPPAALAHLDGWRAVTVGRLDSIAAVRREAARLYTAARRGEMLSEDASRLGNLLAIIGRLIEQEDGPRQLPSWTVHVEPPKYPDSAYAATPVRDMGRGVAE